jgi:hypothetical protein
MSKNNRAGTIGRRRFLKGAGAVGAVDIYAFLQSLPVRRPVKDFPILNN